MQDQKGSVSPHLAADASVAAFILFYERNLLWDESRVATRSPRHCDLELSGVRRVGVDLVFFASWCF